MDFNDLAKRYNIIFLCRFGSHLYGTNTETSDTDYKGIYLPYVEDCLTQNVKKSINLDTNRSNEKNSAEDIDCEIYSLQHFIHLACKGETVAIDMLHCNTQNTIITSPQFEKLRAARSKFYTRNMKAFIGYAQKQAAKYGLKGSRLAAAKKLLQYLNTAATPNDKILYLWDDLPTDEHMFHLPDDNTPIRKFAFCGKQIQSTAKISYVIDIINKFIEQYGNRAKEAEKNKGVDWKAVSHALRAAYQLQEIYATNDLKFPLEKRKVLLNIKQGRVDFKVALNLLENAIEKISQEADSSNLPDAVDENYAKDLIKELYGFSKGQYHDSRF